MANGDSGEFFTMHVRLMVEPVFMKTSGPPMIVVNGSENVILLKHEHDKHLASVYSPTTDK